MGRYYWTVNGELPFSLYLPSTDQEPTFEHFVNEISIRRFLPFTDCGHLLYRRQLIKKLAHANNKVSKLISNRATSVKVTKK